MLHYYDRFNAWHKKNFGVMPEYETYGQTPEYHCTLRYFIPENLQNLHRDRREDTEAESRSAARELAARRAYEFVVYHGLWASIAITPRLEDSINQLQELQQKEILTEFPSYSFTQISPEKWYCVCTCGDLKADGFDVGKTKAKKKAAYNMLNRLMKGMSCTINIQTGENTYIGSQQQASDKVADNLRTKKIVWR